LRLLAQLARLAASRTFWMAGNRSPIRMAMMAMTTSSSIKVKPKRLPHARERKETFMGGDPFRKTGTSVADRDDGSPWTSEERNAPRSPFRPSWSLACLTRYRTSLGRRSGDDETEPGCRLRACEDGFDGRNRKIGCQEVSVLRGSSYRL